MWTLRGHPESLCFDTYHHADISSFKGARGRDIPPGAAPGRAAGPCGPDPRKARTIQARPAGQHPSHALSAPAGSSAHASKTSLLTRCPNLPGTALPISLVQSPFASLIHSMLISSLYIRKCVPYSESCHTLGIQWGQKVEKVTSALMEFSEYMN